MLNSKNQFIRSTGSLLGRQGHPVFQASKDGPDRRPLCRGMAPLNVVADTTSFRLLCLTAQLVCVARSTILPAPTLFDNEARTMS